MSQTVSSGGGSSQAERFRPSEINGCVVQQVSYLEEIDDDDVLEALERLRGKSLAVPVGAFVTTRSSGKPPRAPSRQSPSPHPQFSSLSIASGLRSNSSTNSSTTSHLTMAAGHVKGSHRSFDSKKKQGEVVPQAAPLTPDSSVASSVSGKNRSSKKNPQHNPTASSSNNKKKLTWTWLGQSLSEFQCGGGLTMKDGIQKVGVLLDNGGEDRPKRLIPLSAFNSHFINRCNGNDDDWEEYDDDDDDDETFQSTVMTLTDDSTYISGGEGRRNRDARGGKEDFRSRMSRIFDSTAKIFVEGGFGDSDSVTLYAYNDLDFMYDPERNQSLDETFFTLESATYDDETATMAQAPDDEIHQDLRVSKSLLVARRGSQSFTKLGRITFTSSGSTEGVFSHNSIEESAAAFKEEGHEIGMDGVPQQLLVVGYDPPEDCSLLSESSVLYMQAINKKGKPSNSSRRSLQYA